MPTPVPPLLALGLLLASVAQAQPTLSLQPASARPGDPVLLTVRGASQAPTGMLAGRPLRFFPAAGGFQSLGALPVEQQPGALPVKVTLPESPPVELSATLDVQPPSWRVRVLKVAREFTEPPPEVRARMDEDRAAFAAAFAQPFAPPAFRANFAWPRKARITAPFGDQRTFNGKVQSQHFGTDLNGHTGAPVHASNDGTVVMARDNYAAGNTVLLHHGGGLYTAYFHLSRMLVKDGQKVRRGQKLGLVGNTGRVTGPHLHWGAKVDGIWVDAETLLKLDFSGAGPTTAEGG